MSKKAILILVLLVATLLTVLKLTDEKPTIEQTAELRVLDGRSLRQAKRIRWQFHNKIPIEIGRDAKGQLQLVEPIRDTLSQGHLNNIANAWDSAQMHAVPMEDDEDGRKNSGLDTPKLQLIVEYPDGARYEIDVGNAGPLGVTHFLRRDGKIWEGGTQALSSSLNVAVDDLRERQIFRNDYTQALEVQVEQQLESGKRETLHLEVKEGQWHLKEPVQGVADPVAARRFVTGLLSLRADYFHTGMMRRPERDPDMLLKVRGMQGEENLKLWLKEGQLYGQIPERGNLAFNSDNRQYGQIFINLAQELRARILVPMGKSTFEEMLELIIDPGQGPGKDRIRLVRRTPAEKWKLVEPVECETRATPVSEAAHALQLLIAREFVSDDSGVRPRAEDPRYGLRAGRWTVSTRRQKESEVNTLWFGADVPNQEEATVYVCRADEPDNVALVPKHPFTVLQRPFTEYCSREILNQPATIERMVAIKGDTSRTFLINDGNWILESTGEERPRVGDFAVDVLPDLSGRRVVDMREQRGFGAPHWELSLTRRHGDELGRLRIWDPGEGKKLIVKGRNDEDVGHEISATVSDQLRALWK